MTETTAPRPRANPRDALAAGTLWVCTIDAGRDVFRRGYLFTAEDIPDALAELADAEADHLEDADRIVARIEVRRATETDVERWETRTAERRKARR